MSQAKNSLRRRIGVVGMAATALASAVVGIVATATPAAAGPVTDYVFFLNPIARTGSLLAGHHKTVRVVAEDASRTPQPNVTLFLSFSPQSPTPPRSAGSAFSQGRLLNALPQQFRALSDGAVFIDY